MNIAHEIRIAWAPLHLSRTPRTLEVCMYRIELSPGEETAFRSIEELAVAIRRNVVTSRARIYHNATAKWLPIQFHPHYKLALSMPLTQADLVAGPPVTPLSTLRLGDPAAAPAIPAPSTREAASQAAAAWPEPKPTAPRVAPPAPTSEIHRKAPAQIHQKVAPFEPPIVLGTPAPEPQRSQEVPRPIELWKPIPPRRVIEPMRPILPARSEPVRRMVAPLPSADLPRPRRSGRRKSKRSLRVALAAAVLIACAHLAVTSASFPGSESAARPRTPRRLIQVPAEALKDVGPQTVAAVMPVLQSIPVPGLKSSPGGVRSSARPRPTLPSAVPPAADSTIVPDAAPDIEAAPEAGEISGVGPLHAESLTAQAVDSSSKKALKRILRAVGGSPAVERKPARH